MYFEGSRQIEKAPGALIFISQNRPVTLSMHYVFRKYYR